jgi:hypothetical protein
METRTGSLLNVLYIFMLFMLLQGWIPPSSNNCIRYGEKFILILKIKAVHNLNTALGFGDVCGQVFY